ncbi:hypothetical protein FE391_41680 [Nonomuraea sp. KC401]|uniref:hypothetical protein n=1 Tax=unclassified Nonomuraea TaxID=2593643 RepID=UPI0010FE07E2|nr:MULTISPECIES: hypothetical protein [unclassified Nonomuraea]NBE99986.1 hypothetical protein [Nonomuraea sp. K271]TLF54483.1 hypothetical protein FE391_41680 [Nonomuraea sp. KC401]
MAWFRRPWVKLTFPDIVLLPSKTRGVHFEAIFDIKYRPGSASQLSRDSCVRRDVRSLSCNIASQWQADEASAAQDAINVELGGYASCPHGFYKDLVGSVELSVDRDGLNAALQERADQVRFERLKWLREALYYDPSLLVIDHLERHPETLLNADFKVDNFWKFSNRLRSAEKWWSPLMAAWTELAAKTQSQQAIEQCMRVLLDAILRLDARLAAEHKLPTGVDKSTAYNSGD